MPRYETDEPTLHVEDVPKRFHTALDVQSSKEGISKKEAVIRAIAAYTDEPRDEGGENDD